MDSPSYHWWVVKTAVIMISETVIMHLLFLLWKVLRFFLLFYFLSGVWITLHGNIKRSFFKKMRYVLLFTSCMWLKSVFFISTRWQPSPTRLFMAIAFSNKCSRSTWLPQVRKWSGKIKFLQGQGKVREFHFESGKIYVSQKSGKSEI